jgi:hypothetical protein
MLVIARSAAPWKPKLYSNDLCRYPQAVESNGFSILHGLLEAMETHG